PDISALSSRAAQTGRELTTRRRLLKRSLPPASDNDRIVRVNTAAFVRSFASLRMTFGLPPRHHFHKETFEIFRFGNCRQHGMIRRLLEPAQSSRGTPDIDKRIGDCLRKCGIAHVMRA